MRKFLAALLVMALMTLVPASGIQAMDDVPDLASYVLPAIAPAHISVPVNFIQVAPAHTLSMIYAQADSSESYVSGGHAHRRYIAGASVASRNTFKPLRPHRSQHRLSA